MVRRRRFCLRKIIQGIVPGRQQIDPARACAVDFQRAQQVGVIRIQSTPRSDRSQFGRIGLTATRRGLKRHGIAIRFLVMDFGSGKFGPPDRLLHRVDEREQMRRRQHPMPALDRALEHMRDAILI